MEMELFEDKIKKNYNSHYISKDEVLSFIMLNWKGKEEELFGDKYRIAKFVENYYFNELNCNKILPNVFVIIVKDFKKTYIKSQKEYVNGIKIKLDDVSDFMRGYYKTTLKKALKRLCEMKKYIKEELNEY